MKILVVTSGNFNKVSPFILDQVETLRNRGIIIDFFLIKGSGILGYLKNYSPLLKKIKDFNPQIVHAHYGLSGLLSVLQKKIPVVVTFHGCDINVKKNRYFSKIADNLSKESIFVSPDLAFLLHKKKPIIIPCGVDLEVFNIIDKLKARRELNLSLDKKYILFSSSFTNEVKNYPLANEAISRLSDTNIKLIELDGYSRREVALLLNAVDVALMTSFREGSPQFIKEAMACNTPIVCTDVGDVRGVIGNTLGCFITTFDIEDVSYKINKALIFNKRTTGRDDIKNFDSNVVTKRVIDVYKKTLEK